MTDACRSGGVGVSSRRPCVTTTREEVKALTAAAASAAARIMATAVAAVCMCAAPFGRIFRARRCRRRRGAGRVAWRGAPSNCSPSARTRRCSPAYSHGGHGDNRKTPCRWRFWAAATNGGQGVVAKTCGGDGTRSLSAAKELAGHAFRRSQSDADRARRTRAGRDRALLCTCHLLNGE